MIAGTIKFRAHEAVGHEMLQCAGGRDQAGRKGRGQGSRAWTLDVIRSMGSLRRLVTAVEAGRKHARIILC